MGAKPLQNEQVTFKNVQLFYEYGQTITIQAEYETDSIIDSVSLYLHPDQQLTQVIEIQNFSDGQIIQDIPVNQVNVYPFTRIYYWFEIQFSNGETVTTSSYWVDYMDNQHDWSTKQYDAIEIYWFEKPDNFAQDVYNTAKLGLEKITQILDTSFPEKIKIIIYPDAASLQSALNIQDTLWVAGHANPSLGMVVISIPSGPNQQLELERQLPHELMHLAEYQISGPTYANQPVWLKEGLASIVELYPNADYQRILEKAAQEQKIQPISSYCNQFPIDAAAAFQAYAQSWSFVNYLYDQFGSDSIQQLMLNYRNGLSCEEGFSQTYNKTIYEVEKDWKKTILNMDVSLLGGLSLSDTQLNTSLSTYSPYFLLSIVLIIPPFISGLWLNKKRKHG